MPTINPNLFGRVSSVETQTPSRQSPSKGEGQPVVGIDRLRLGSETVSADEAVKILVERVASYVQEALAEAKVANPHGLPVEVPPEAPEEAVAKRLFDFSVGFFEKFEESRSALSGPDARRLFASLMAEAADEGLSATYNLLHGLKAFVSSELAAKLETIRDLLAEMLEEFASGEVREPRREAGHSEGFTAKGFAPKSEEGEGAVFKAAAYAHRTAGSSEAGASERVKELIELLPIRGQRAALGAGDRAELGVKQPSEGQVMRILGDRILANVREALRELGFASTQGLPVEAAIVSSPEAVADRIFEAVMRLFAELVRQQPASAGASVNPEAFARLIDEALERGVSDTLGFYRVMNVVLGGEAQANVEKIAGLLSKMMDEFVAEGLRDLPPKALPYLLAEVRKPEAPPKEALSGSPQPKESSPAPGALPALRSPQMTQAHLVPPESTVLAMTKQSLSKKLYTSGESHALPLTVSVKVSLGTLIGTLFGMAVVLNAPWELANLVLQQGWESLGPAGLFTSVKAAVGDGLLMVALYGMGCALFQDREWILRPKSEGYSFLVAAGAAVAFALEWHASTWSRWAPRALMPVTTVFGVGLLPLLQFMVLPLMAAYLSRIWLWRYTPIDT